MRTIKSLSSIASALFLGTLLFTSCGDPWGIDNQDVVESQVLDRGLGDKVTQKQLPNSDTELTYESWIKVKTKTVPKTRAGSDDGTVFTVLLKDVFHNTDTTLVIDNYYFDLGDYTTDVSYRTQGTCRDGYTTVTDSVMVYTVSYNDFSFEYEIEYEVAVYDDGISRGTLPYHKIQNLRDNGVTIEKLESVHDQSLTVFARRQLNHSISVELDGETYTMKGKVILQTPFDSAIEPYVKKSELLSTSYFTVGEYVHSELRVKQWWSDGQVKTETIDTQLYASFDDFLRSITFDIVLPDNLEITSSYLGDVYELMQGVTLQKYVSSFIESRMFFVSYSFIDFGMKLERSIPRYYDGYTYREFATPEFKNFRFSEQTLEKGQSGVKDGRHWTNYWLTRYVKADFDKVVYESPINISLVLYDE